jgi:hypothetical protein
MNKKNIFKNKIYLLDYDADDETDVVSWIEKNKSYNCECYDNIICSNCECNNNENDDDDDDDDDETEISDVISNISSFNINIINNKHKGKKVRITLQLNVNLSNNKKELITIEVDINKTTYLKIAQELFK